MSNSYKIFGIYVLAFLCLFFLYRTSFLVLYRYRLDGAGWAQILKAYLAGIRFDLAATTILLSPFFLLSLLPYLSRFSIYRILWGFPPVLLFIWAGAHLVSDTIYFENANKHIGYEGIVFLGRDFGVIFLSAFEQNPISMAVIMVLVAIGLPFAYYIYKKYVFPKPWQKAKLAYASELVLGLFLIVAGIRGGIQPSPLRTSNAIISNNGFINNLSLNGVYTTIMDMKAGSVHKSQMMKLEEAAILARKEIEYPGAEFISLQYPMLRKTKDNPNKKPPNIVLVLLENWTGKFLSPIGDGRIDGIEVAPEFNSLVKKGIFFKNFFATGGRTTNGLLSVLAGMPDRPGLTAVRTPKIMNRLSGLGTVLKRAGYSTHFFYGGEMSFDDMDFLMPHLGFDELFGLKELSKDKNYKLSSWGYDDGDLFDFTHKRILELGDGKPFLSVILTLTTHYPYRVPDSKFSVFKEATRDYEYLNVYHYADWAVGDFLRKAAKEKYAENTIFIFVADHAHHRFLSYYEDRNIPFLIYSPKLIQPALREDIASQLDVFPTIVGLTGKKVLFSAMGKDLFATSSHSAYFAYGNVFGWIEDNLFFFQWSDGNKGINFTVRPPHVENPVCSINFILCQPHYNKAKSFLNLSSELLDRNRIMPSNEELSRYLQ